MNLFCIDAFQSLYAFLMVVSLCKLLLLLQFAAIIYSLYEALSWNIIEFDDTKYEC